MVIDRNTGSKASLRRRVAAVPLVADHERVNDHPVAAEPILRCRECGEPAPGHGPQYCSWCFGPVEVVLPEVPGAPGESKAAIAAGPSSLARYRPLLPSELVLDDRAPGWTPLVAAPELGRAVGVPDLWIKDETANPTGSFKDRVVELAMARGVQAGACGVACTSTGNLARATAAAAARRGLPALIIVPEGLDDGSVLALGALGATVVAVRGGYDAASRLGAEAAADLDQWAWVNVTLRPWYELGARTMGWEMAEQLGWRLPDRVVVPVASGALARALHESMTHLVATGLAEGTSPRLTAMQAAGCAPVAAAFAEGSTMVRPIARPDTVAPSLAMGDPPDGPAVVAAARATEGVVNAVDEDRILAACELVEETTGVAVEPAGGVVVAGLADLAAGGTVEPDERVVAVLTGGPRRAEPTAPGSEVVPRVGLADTIDASVDALTDLLAQHHLT